MQCNDVASTSERLNFDVMCPLGYAMGIVVSIFFYFCWLFNQALNFRMDIFWYAQINKQIRTSLKEKLSDTEIPFLHLQLTVSQGGEYTS